jgi:Protein of unknown function (DUF2846)
MVNKIGYLLAALLVLAPAAWADSYETPVPAPPPQAAAPPPEMPGPASPKLARVYIYREFGSYQHLSWTPVWFNGARVGDSAPGTYFYRDVEPGTYTITLRTEEPYPDQFKTVTVPPGSTTYVKVWALDDYAISAVPAVNLPHHHFDGVRLFAPNTFVNAVIDPLVARPVIAKLEPMS